ncbi:FUSC family protein [Streptomyces sp. NPDC006296]|uniref:FUSC family protein n=1 Tax=Streptomyces sp. NPDC006296 TaxID=3156746 RepID=UPI0033A9C955
MAGERTRGRSTRTARALGRLAKVFELDATGINWPRAVMFADAALVVLVVFWTIGHEQYLISALFGLLFAALADPGGGYGHRASHIAVFGLAGAGVTALGFGIGGAAWGWLVLAAFAVTLATGLTIVFGVHRFVAALLLNIWLIVTLGVASGLHRHPLLTSETWAQVLAWTGGSALWIALVLAGRLIRGRQERPRPVAEIPGDTGHRKLTRPVIVFVLIRALVMAGTTAAAFGLDLSHGYWLPVAAVVAMKPSLEQSTRVAAQRLAGALIGAVAAALLLLLPSGEHGLRLLSVDRALGVVALFLLMHAVAIRFWNYALCSAAVAAGVLVLVDLPQPSHHAAEGYRVLWTLCGVGAGVLVMLLAQLLAEHTARAPSQSA